MDEPVTCPSVMPILERGGLKKLHHMAVVASGVALTTEALGLMGGATGHCASGFDRRAEELHGRYLDLACA